MCLTKKVLQAADRSFNEQDFQKTGKHPALDGAHTHVLPSLPVRDPNRPHVFLSFASGKTDLGKPVSCNAQQDVMTLSAACFVPKDNLPTELKVRYSGMLVV